MKNEQWSKFNLPGSHLFFGNEPNRILGPKEQPIYDDYVRMCDRLGCSHATDERWRMESQRIPNV